MTGSKLCFVAAVLIVAIFLVGCGTPAQAASPQTKSSTNVAVTTTSLPTGMVSTTYSAQVQASGGVPPYKWSLAPNTKLPAGVSFDSVQGTFSGIPNQQGNFQVGVQVTDSSSSGSGKKNLTLQVTPPLSVGGGILGAATVGVSYSTTLAASGGSSPYNWVLSSGSLPAGLSLASNGTISGTPTAAASASFTVTATDSASPAHTASGTYSLSVAAATVVITTTSLPSGQVNTAYNAAMTASGGAAPYTWSISAGSLAPGLSLDSNTGMISGTPTASGTYAVTLSATDTMGRSGSSQFSIVIAAAAVLALQISTASLPDAYTGIDYSSMLAATGGTAPYTWSISAGSLPGALALAATTGSITGIPSAAGLFSVTFQVADSAAHTATKTLSVSVSSSSLDTYGGVTSVSCAPSATNDWNMQKLTIGGKMHWVFCTPLGHPFIKRGVYYITADSSHTSTEIPLTNSTYLTNKYGASDAATFSNKAYARLKSWGFNAGAPGAWRNASSSDVQAANKVPFTEYGAWQTNLKCINSSNCKNLWNLLWPPTHPYDTGSRQVLDSFDPAYTTIANTTYANDTGIAAIKSNPYYIGNVTGDGDWYSTFGAGPDFPTDPGGKAWGHTVWYVAQSTPRQMVNPRNSWAVFADPTNFTKKDFADFLQAKYGTIAALNAAWNSNYSTFGSTGTSTTGVTLSGAGVGPYVGTLSRATAVDRFSVLIKVAGVGKAGDDGFGKLVGTGVASGTIDYNTGAISITFSATPSGSVSVDYYADGWGTGSGLLDEAGNVHAWFPSDKVYLTGATTAMKSDFEDYLTRYVAQTLGVVAKAFHAVAPTKLFFGTTYIGGWREPGRCGALKGAAQVLDVVQVGGWDGSQAEADFIGNCTGDKPFTLWYSLLANPDSEWYDVPYTESALGSTNSQAARAAIYQKDIANYWNTCNSSTGVCSWVGLDWWAYYSVSYWQKMSFGLVSWRDNAYDGNEAVSGSVSCSAPTQNYMCGGEHGNYGNFLGPVTTTNRQIDLNLTVK